MPPSLERHESVFVVDFGKDENFTTHAWCEAMEALLDEVEAAEGPGALVTTGSGKFYTSGLDTDYLAAQPDDAAAYVSRVIRVIGRIFAGPLPSVAAVNGHAFGMGAFLTIAHDHAVMREDRGFVCWPEIQLGMAFPPALVELNRARLAAATMHEAMLSGHRFPASEALAQGIISETAAKELVLQRAIERAAPLAPTAGKLLAKIKRQIHGPVIERLLGSGL